MTAQISPDRSETLGLDEKGNTLLTKMRIASSAIEGSITRPGGVNVEAIKEALAKAQKALEEYQK